MAVDIEVVLIVVIPIDTPTLGTHPSTAPTTTTTTKKPASSSLHHLLFPQHLLALAKCKFALPKRQLAQLRRRRPVVGLVVRTVLRLNSIAIDQIPIEGNVAEFLQVIVEGTAARRHGARRKLPPPIVGPWRRVPVGRHAAAAATLLGWRRTPCHCGVQAAPAVWRRRSPGRGPLAGTWRRSLRRRALGGSWVGRAKRRRRRRRVGRGSRLVLLVEVAEDGIEGMENGSGDVQGLGGLYRRAQKRFDLEGPASGVVLMHDVGGQGSVQLVLDGFLLEVCRKAAALGGSDRHQFVEQLVDQLSAARLF